MRSLARHPAPAGLPLRRLDTETRPSDTASKNVSPCCRVHGRDPALIGLQQLSPQQLSPQGRAACACGHPRPTRANERRHGAARCWAWRRAAEHASNHVAHLLLGRAGGGGGGVAVDPRARSRADRESSAAPLAACCGRGSHLATNSLCRLSSVSGLGYRCVVIYSLRWQCGRRRCLARARLRRTRRGGDRRHGASHAERIPPRPRRASSFITRGGPAQPALARP